MMINNNRLINYNNKIMVNNLLLFYHNNKYKLEMKYNIY